MATLPTRTKDDPWKLKTPPGTSEYTMHTDEKDGREILVCTVGKTVLHYDLRCIGDLQAMLKATGDWVELGGADEQKTVKAETVEAWGRLVRSEEGVALPLRCVRTAPDGSTWSLRARAQRQKQPHACQVSKATPRTRHQL